jgi:transposase-like protein
MNVNSTYEKKQAEIPCPGCNSEVVYRYGHAWTGRQRFLCVICGKQFTNGAKVSDVKGKPLCPLCGKSMHIYKIEGDVIRFRCSAYPECKGFRKFRLYEEEK